MQITSLTFALFVLGVVGIYYLLPRRAQNYWLLISSYVFHISWSIQFAFVLFVSTLVNFWLASRLRTGLNRRRVFLGIGIGANLASLVIFRLSNFFLPEFTVYLQHLGMHTPGESLKFLVPLGLSFYVLQNISYLIDVYKKQMEACVDLVDFSLYLAYFPKLLAGPIERAKIFLSKLANPRTIDNLSLTKSLTLIFIGLARKIIIADTLASALPWDVFKFPANFSALELWFWLFVYAFSIYNDFAGYTNIVRGVSGLFGIELSVNFNYPYFSRNFSEFWNRWHISFSHWLRDYIYYPLSRVLRRKVEYRYHPANLIIPPMATMLFCGLWHGFSWHMLLWGGLHGAYLVGERIYHLARPGESIKSQSLKGQWITAGIVFIMVAIAWVPFNAEVPETIQYWLGLLRWNSLNLKYSRAILVLPFLLVIAGLDWILYNREGELTITGMPRLVQASFWGGVMFAIYILSQPAQGNVFVYQGF
jgi:alginate O-acetyltransferase complex protein AlgI